MSGRPQPPGHDAVPVEDWPGADRAALEQASRPGLSLRRRGRAAQWRPATRRSLVGAYARWLGFLSGAGCALEAEAPPDRLSSERIRAYVGFLQARCAPVTVASYIGQLHMFVRDVWPGHDWRWLCAVQASLLRDADPVRNKAARLVPQAELLDLGLDIMQRAEAMPLPADLPAGPKHPALLFRDGLMIALLAMRPLRQANFLGLTLHRHLTCDAEGWWISVPAAETKNRLSLRMPFPGNVVDALERYLDAYRPLLLAMRGPRDGRHKDLAAGAHLWITRCGTPLTAGALQKLLRRHTRARFGHEVNCHLFRDCLASTMADDDPVNVRLAADVLGHRSFRTTQAHYISANVRLALRHIQALITAERRARRRADSQRSRRPSRQPRSGGA